MSQKYIKIRNEGAKYYVDLNGVLDEDVNFSEVNCKSPEEIFVDFEKVQSINSCGIREWIRWIMNYTDCKITYLKCPKIIVDQINMVDGFLPKNGVVASFFVPYYNEESGSEQSVLFSFGKEYNDQSVMPPENVKDASGNPMEMDIIESKYFKFIQKKIKTAA